MTVVITVVITMVTTLVIIVMVVATTVAHMGTEVMAPHTVVTLVTLLPLPQRHQPSKLCRFPLADSLIKLKAVSHWILEG